MAASSPPESTVVRNGRLLDARAHSADPADILIRGDTIAEVGPPGLAAPVDAVVVDATERLLIPGLVNAHTHGHGSLVKGMGDRWSLELLLNAGSWMNTGRTLDDLRLGATLNAIELVRKGCTAAYDLVFEFPVPTVEGLEAVRLGYASIGVRAVVAPMMADRLLYEAIPGLLEAIPQALRGEVERLQAAPYEQSLAALRRVLPEGRTDRTRFDLALAPTIPLHCTDEFMVACRDLAREQDVRLHMHLAESKTQAVAGPRVYGHSLTTHLDKLGLLGPSFTGAHCVWLDEDDIRRMSEHGATIAHNPGSNLRLGSGVAPTRAMLDAGVTLGIGTDGSQCSDNQNLFEAMRIAAFVSRVENPDVETWLSAEEVFHAATAGGAASLGLDAQVGRVAPGYQADLVFLDLTSINYTPLNDPLFHVVYSEDGSAVDSVMIGGQLVLDHGRITTLDERRVRREAQRAADRLRTAGAERRALADRLAEHVARHCTGMSRASHGIQRWIGG